MTSAKSLNVASTRRLLFLPVFGSETMFLVPIILKSVFVFSSLFYLK